MSKEGKNQTEQALSAADFVHLHNHTNYSVLDGLTRVGDLCQFVKDSGMVAVAMTDHGTISGWIDLYKNATEREIKPIFGLETYMATRKHTDRDPAKDKQRFHLTLLAMNNEGYKNIMRLSSIANLDGMYYKPRIDHDLLEKYNAGVICLSGCAGGEIGQALRDDDYDKAVEIAKWHRGVFGDRYYIELQDHGHPESPKYWPEQKKVNDGLLKIAAELDIPAVLTCDAHYLKASDAEAHEILLCVGTGSFLSETDRMTLAEFDLHVISPEDIVARWGKDHPELIRNSRAIADRCEVTLDLGGILIPTFPCPDGLDEKTYLHQLVWRGLARRYGVSPDDNDIDEKQARKLLNKTIVERADYELGVIDQMGFNGYFLIVWDFIDWGKRQGIVFGPGRGSAAGSIISYALRITDLDPLEYDLLFERFLNPDRISMPDIDIDIQDTRRNEVIEYCTEKYGADRVSNIGTFGKMMARNAAKDVARVLEVPYAESDRLSKMIPATIQGRPIPLKDSIVNDPDLKVEYESNAASKRVLDYAIQLEGTIRSHGVHAAGVVIAPDELVKYAPVEMAQKGVVATQFPMGPIEELGLLKMDFLGLKNLTIINNALRIVRKVYDKEIDIYNVPMDDKKTFELFQRADTTGVFQLESAGMKRYLKELKPTEFNDIIAMVALYRPGPMSEIPSFIKRKHGKEPITYLDPHMESALGSTYGILVYQEQFMQISKDMCGFTGGQADTLRKAVGKKKIDLMRQMQPMFIDGAVKNSGADRGQMEKFWEHLEEFANYCFNKSHAACYALVAYWTAYIKAHYPSAFMAALMTSDSSDTDRLAIEIAECQHMGIKVLLPEINESYAEFAVVPKTGDVRFGLAAVKGVGVAVVEKLEEARKLGGKFLSVEDYAKRVDSKVNNKRVWESLIKSGAFDGFGDRSDLLFNLEALGEYSRKVQSEAASGQGDLFGALAESGVEVDEALPSVKITPAPTKYSEKDMLGWERELLGLYISAHPLDKYSTFFDEQTVGLSSLTSGHDGLMVTVGGVINSVRSIVTKNGSKMAFVAIEDKTGEGEIVIFPSVFEKAGAILAVDKVVKITGRISGRDKNGQTDPDPKILAETVSEISDVELDSYKPTGVEMTIDQAKLAPARSRGRRAPADGAENIPRSSAKSAAPPPPPPEPEAPPPKKLYLHIKNPNDAELLTQTKAILSKFTGESEIIMVLGEDKTDALRLPFKAEIGEELLGKLEKIYAAGCVVVK
ncbi:MAG: DNA polymerase III subunit alpha [Candidatus Nomurabacteria bacterium]|jgi:DNA polymerase-3 subunit alpha|nr:DNA polymerase III subunit alpha [Candidatus Nomurabacteria bacterium]